MNTKDQTINFRVDETTKQLLKNFAQELNLKESEFIRKAILSFKELTSQVQAAALDKEKIQALKGNVNQLNYQLDGYEKNEMLNSLFQKYKGHTIEGKKITSKSVLIELLAKRTTVEVVEENVDTQESEFSMSPINLQAHLTPVIVEEPITWQQIKDGLKRNWIWLIGLGVALLIFIFWRWTAIMKMRPKIIQYPSPKAEITELAA